MAGDNKLLVRLIIFKNYGVTQIPNPSDVTLSQQALSRGVPREWRTPGYLSQ